jgi:hypothetical protein
MTKLGLLDITLTSGVHFSYTDPGKTFIPIEDIAHSLGNICRFAGHCRQYFSVAQHAWNCSYAVEPEFAFDALMHDTSEAFTNDLPSPLKRIFPEFKKLETTIETAVAKMHGFTYPLPEAVHKIDRDMLALEKEHLFPNTGAWEWLEGCDISYLHSLVAVGELNMGLMSPSQATALFLQRYEELKNG